MSRNNKGARNGARAKQYSALRQKGESGPAKTTPAHGKRWTYRSNPDAMKRLAEAVKELAIPKRKTSGKQILEEAGGAAK